MGITLSRIQPRGEDLQVWIDEVPFNRLLTWLGALQSKQGITAASLDLNSTETPGQVKVRRLLLTRV
jgi:general secretion pathway protein M